MFGTIGKAVNDAVGFSEPHETRIEKVVVKDPETGERKVVQAEVCREREPDGMDFLVGIGLTGLGIGLLAGSGDCGE